MSDLREWLRSLPKAELHVHLEGTISPQAYKKVAERNGYSVPSDPETAFACSDFGSFLKAFVGVVRAFREPEDFAEVAQAYLTQSAQSGVRHVEFFFSPATIRYFHKSADLIGILQAIHAAAQSEKKRSGISSLILLDMVRNFGLDAALADIDLAQQSSEYGVVGVGLGGDERNFPARDFFKPFGRAKQLGLRRTAHAGEAAGSDSVRDAIEVLAAERIGHGVAAADAAEVLDLIKQRGVGIDSCITSNLITGESLNEASHPLKRFLALELPVTLSSDDPSFFRTTILDEFERAIRAGLTKVDAIRLARNSFLLSFAPESAKRAWLDDLDAYVSQAA